MRFVLGTTDTTPDPPTVEATSLIVFLDGGRLVISPGDKIGQTVVAAIDGAEGTVRAVATFDAQLGLLD